MQKLFEDFSPVSREAWVKKATADLRGKTLDDITSLTRDGIKIRPFYTSVDAKPQPTPAHLAWTVMQEILVFNEADANTQALEALDRGASGLVFYLSPNTLFHVLLSGISMPHIKVHFVGEDKGADILSALIAYAEEFDLDINQWHFTINKDTFENVLRSGNWFESLEADLADLQTMAQSSVKGLKPLCINANIYHNSGATAAQELGIALAHAHEYLHRLSSENGNKFWFNFAIGPNYFEQIAKLRAFRRLWNLVLEKYNLGSSKTIVYAETGTRNKTIYDAHVNMLRTTTEAMSAILGGCDELCIKPFDLAYNPSEFGERIARNQQLLLDFESYLGKTQDPAAGSYFIENLTEELAQKAWTIFQEIEGSGGYLKNIENGKIQEMITAAADAEQADFDSGKLSLLGTNLYQDKAEKMSDKMEYGMFSKTPPNPSGITPLVAKRLSESVEKERLQTEENSAK